MEQNGEFNFTREPAQVDLELKKQKAAYLAERNARKKQAQNLMRKEVGFGSSSESETEIPKKQIAVVAQFNQKSEDIKTSSPIQISPKQP